MPEPVMVECGPNVTQTSMDLHKLLVEEKLYFFYSEKYRRDYPVHCAEAAVSFFEHEGVYPPEYRLDT